MRVTDLVYLPRRRRSLASGHRAHSQRSRLHATAAGVAIDAVAASWTIRGRGIWLCAVPDAWLFAAPGVGRLRYVELEAVGQLDAATTATEPHDFRLHDLRHRQRRCGLAPSAEPEGGSAGAGTRYGVDDDGPLRPPGRRQPVAGWRGSAGTSRVA